MVTNAGNKHGRQLLLQVGPQHSAGAAAVPAAVRATKAGVASGRRVDIFIPKIAFCFLKPLFAAE